MSSDYLMRRIARWEGQQPYDEYGHALNPNERSGDEALDLTSPYGSLQYAVGSGDDFWCFDFGGLEDGRIALHAVINSETGSFIMDAPDGYEIVRADEAVTIAVGMIDRALEWCADNRIRHDHKGWNQDPYYFARSVACAVGAMPRSRLVRRAIKNRIPIQPTKKGE